MNAKLKIILLLFASVFMVSACSGHSSKQDKDTNRSDQTDRNITQKVNTPPQSVLPDTTATVKGYETDKYFIWVDKKGTYSVDVSSHNTSLIFVIQDANGNNITDETSEWKGELEKGNYTIIVGLMRNAARRNLNNEVEYQIKVKRE